MLLSRFTPLVLVIACAMSGLSAKTPPATMPTDQSSAAEDVMPTHVPDPIPESGRVPTIPGATFGLDDESRTARIRLREYEQQLRILKRKYFGRRKADALRDAGLSELREFTDPAAFSLMMDLFGTENSDTTLWLLDHFAQLDNDGQTMLARVAVTHAHAGIRHEATQRLTLPPAPGVLGVLDRALRSDDTRIVTNAAVLATAHNILETIPLLIFGQGAAAPRAAPQGDIAWLAIETQRAYVQGVNPVAGNGAGGFAPVLGTVSEGVVMRVQDAVVITYRTVVHRALVSMTSADWGQSTAHLGYDLNGWWAWYNSEYVPYKARQAALEALDTTETQAIP